MKKIGVSLWEISSAEAKELPKEKPVLCFNALTQNYQLVTASKVLAADANIFYFLFDLEGVA